MKVIKPTPIGQFSDVEYENVPLSLHPEWEATASYTVGDMVYSSESEYIAVADSTGVDPKITSETPTWFKTGVVNRLRPFDLILSNPMQAEPGSDFMRIRLKLSTLADQVVLFGLVGKEVAVKVFSPQGTELVDQSKTVELIDSSGVSSWHDYFFSPISALDEAMFEDVAGYPGNTIEITVSSPNGTARLGQAVVGRGRDLGVVCEGSTVGIQDYSRKERDDWGNPKVIERPFSLSAEYDLAIPSSQVRDIRKMLASLRATPAVYVEPELANSFGAMVYGYYKDFSINLRVGETSFLSLEVEGLV